MNNSKNQGIWTVLYLQKGTFTISRAAIDIVLKDTYGNGEDIIYLLNSSDDGQNVNMTHILICDRKELPFLSEAIC